MRDQPRQQIVNGYFTRKSIVNRTLSVLDTIGKFFFFRWKKRPKPKSIHKLLLVHFGGFGDALLLTSVLDSLRCQLPYTEIDLALNRDEYLLLQHDDRISNFHVMENRFQKRYVTGILKTIMDFRRIGKKYDVAVCLRSFIDNGVLPLYFSGITNYIMGFSTGGFSFALDHVIPWNIGIHETEHYRDALMPICPFIEIGQPRICYDREIALDKVNIALGDLSPYFVLHMGSRDRRRTLGVERNKAILSWILEHTNVRIILTGTEQEADLWEEMHLDHPRILPVFGKLDLFSFVECIARSAGVITVETFAAHVGGMCDVHVFSFWSGITDYRQWHPIGNHVTGIRHPVPCSPCFKPCEGLECMHHNISEAAPLFMRAIASGKVDSQ